MNRAIAFALLALLLWTAPRAVASLVEALPLSELVARSEHVVVVEPGPRAGRTAGTLIVTDVELRVLESLKGGSKPGDTLVATLLGGVSEGVGLKVPGEASLPAGAQLVVFLRRAQKPGELRVVGMAQGVLPIDEQQGKRIVMPPAGDAELVKRDGKGGLVHAHGAVAEPVLLPELLTQLRSLVARAPQGAQ